MTQEQLKEMQGFILRGTESLTNGMVVSEDGYSMKLLAVLLRDFTEALAEGRDPFSYLHSLCSGMSLN